MNYILHTRAAHELLTRQPAATPHHVSLYWALFYQWNAERFPAALDLDPQATMQAARIGNKSTYTEKLYDLAVWGLLRYQPSHSKHQPSRCFLTVLPGAEMQQVNEATRCSSAPSETALPVAEVHPVNGATGTTSATGKPALPGAEVQQHSLLGKTEGSVNHLMVNSGGTEKKIGEGLSDEGHSGVELFDDTATHDGKQLTPGEAPKKKVAPKKKGVEQAAIRAAAATPRRSQPRLPEVPFDQSELARYEDFAAAFEGTDYALADLRFYHAKISAWRQKGEPPRRRDWRATAIQFFLNDAHDNRLKLAPGVQHHQPGATAPDAGTLFARTGYRSKYDA
ncbi:hypothetical protein [Hymenobacter weizhouensis]|uniref:hypothetical protein n=1 Tax=Hymenobacter sp. YIM 151500-1 TaxID=2987689 RepID=UPI002227FCA4|nr:hypothetical protein [Hymenobacter sp. YIM 151500-1]UYZ64902.1 hypothetical protein OIS53_08630 [Hymenobacter sp. YIM 151500-1]